MAGRPRITRDTELSTRAAIRKKILDVAKDVEKGFQDQRDRSDKILDNWDLFNCKLGDRQFYAGQSKIFVPIIKDAVKARRTRFVNQIFPQSGRYIDVTTAEGDRPEETMALMETYVRRAKLRTQVIPALMVNGDVEGQYSVYVSWKKTKRKLVHRVKKPIEIMGLDFPEIEEVDTIEEEDFVDQRPHVDVLSDSDVLILPATADSVEEALEVGGSVSVIRRWSKARIRKAIEDEDIVEDVGEDIIKEMSKREGTATPDTAKHLADAAGIKRGSGDKYALVHEIWTMMKVGDEHRLVRIYYAGEDKIAGCKLNPYWCDLCPVISHPYEKIANVAKGRAPIADGVDDLQIFANDTLNEGADTAHFSAMPIIMTDPEKNPRVGSMVLGLGAVWEVDPASTQFAEFPELWRSAQDRVGAVKEQIFQSLGVNPAMIPQSTGQGKKRNQAEIANEQQVDILTTADVVTNLEEGMLTPIVQRFAYYDHQFREDAAIVRMYGEMGLQATMQDVEPIQLNRRFEFKWLGVEAARNAAQMQQQIAMANVIKGIPPNLYPDYDLNLSPLIVQMTENTFGPRLAPLIFRRKTKYSVDPELENEMMEYGFRTPVHPSDDDMQHLQVHMQLMALGDPHGTLRDHMAAHQEQMAQKAQQQEQMGAKPGGAPGGPGGAGPGVAGTPKPGAQPAPTRPVTNAPGSISPDQMPRAGAVTMPRKT